MASKIISNIRVGEADVHPSTPSHMPGVAQGNAPGQEQAGIHKRGMRAKATADRSTGINAENRNPIRADMPNLPPA